MKMLRRLLNFDYDKDSVTDALRWAAWKGNIAAAQLLIKADGEPRDALQYALASNNMGIIQLLLDTGGDLRQYHGRLTVFNTIQSFEAAKIVLIRYPGLSAACPSDFGVCDSYRVIMSELRYATVSRHIGRGRRHGHPSH